MNTIAIYTTYCGNFERATFNAQQINKEIPHYFISNNLQVLDAAKLVGWIPVKLDIPVSTDFATSSEQAKIAKAMPQVFTELQPYRWLFYKDDKISIDYTKLGSHIIAVSERNNAIGLRIHNGLVNGLFANSNILYEFAEGMLQARYYYQRNRIIKYITDQIKLGKQLNTQVYWTSFILRDQNHPQTNQFNCEWFDGIQQCGAECQISFDFVAQQFSDSITILPQNL